MKEVEVRLEELEAEVASLRAELRLIKLKFRHVDPYRNRQIIEKVVSEILDNRSWKIVSTSNAANFSEAYNPGMAMASGGHLGNQILTDDLVQLGDEGGNQHQVEPDPLYANTNIFSSLSDDEISGEGESLNQHSTSQRATSSPAFGRKHLSSGKARGVDKYRRNRKRSSEFKLEACKLANELGPSAAGRQLDVAESSIRSWMKQLGAFGHGVGKTQVTHTTEEIIPDFHPENQATSESKEPGVCQVGSNEYAVLATTSSKDLEDLGESDSSTSSSSPPKEKKPKPSSLLKQERESPAGRRKTAVWASYTAGVARKGSKRVPMICNFCGMEVSAEARRLNHHLDRCQKNRF